MASTIALYVLAAIALTISYTKNKKNTKIALKKAWKSFENILPQFLSILILIGIILAIMTPEQISQIIGKESGWVGVILASIVGAVTLVPGFIAFPLAAALIKSGAGYMQIAAFISTLMMVGIVTIPLEMKFFGKKAALIRNAEAYIFSLVVALVMGVFL